MTLPIFSQVNIIGVDPGPTTGFAVLNWYPPEKPDEKPKLIWHGYQCDAGSARSLLEHLLSDWDGEWTAGETEHFVPSNLPGSPTTVRMENALAEVALDAGLTLARKPMAAVKPWATDKRMIASGAWNSQPEKSLIPAKMVDARAAARHCLMAAVNGGSVPDPLSKGARAA